MKSARLLIVLVSLCLSQVTMQAQKMDNERLEIILNVVSDSIVGENGSWQFQINEKLFMCMTDENHNRMRILSPIVEQDKLSNDDLIKVLEANFYTALDVKYTLSNGVLWSAFIHPLKELTDKQVKDAVSQVYYAVENYGTTYSSTDLVFPGVTRDQDSEETRPQKEKIIRKM